eukprot:CAMPEP_0175051690 /NCGR_PEP_ID=MMETSP0052_2-20121109/7949_1 /TAXON_ID=51329 ORGANISM="Polytomella parva, Strain SAG 63-3" /NCGR_SAMPLE_ID=MMETSP0052_2 /ASSEMBLY_ACC=CAM_ASM_000194 /LENGTH=437 /DNA_ID=CAMNT_0016316021 /DNA_START=579 /DNA_END=1892 /DNA_ORIENTATION=+
MGKNNPLVRLAYVYERFWGRQADASFCVTKAMQDDLHNTWGVIATVLYDRPPSFFRRTSVEVAHDLFRRLQPSLDVPGYSDFLTEFYAQVRREKGEDGGEGVKGKGCNEKSEIKDAEGKSQIIVSEETIITTRKANSVVTLKTASCRPAIVVSSTSWTPDEDFEILLEAAAMYDKKASAAANVAPEVRKTDESSSGTRNKNKTNGDNCDTKQALPNLLLLITGKGPLKESYISKIQSMKWTHVSIRTLWLEASDYPLLLGCCTLGVSLHASSSGLDLPMKIVDMYGAGLPVCALSYDCINELVDDGRTGLIFSSSTQLCQQLQRLFSNNCGGDEAFGGAESKNHRIHNSSNSNNSISNSNTSSSSPGMIGGGGCRYSADFGLEIAQMAIEVEATQQPLKWDANWKKIASPVFYGVGGSKKLSEKGKNDRVVNNKQNK